MKRLLLPAIFILQILTLSAQNPIVQHIYTADPAAMVHGDSVYIYTGHDEATATGGFYVMNDWHVFSTGDMQTFIDHGEVLTIQTFSWATNNAWASHVVERDGMFYWYVTVSPNTDGPFAIGVAVSSSPTGPFVDAVGAPLITGSMTPDLVNDIDPAVFIDDDGQAYLYWGNGGVCKAIRLKDNMIELEGSILDITPPNFTEAAYMHKVDSTYYLTYAANWPESIEYSTGSSPLGPFTHQGTLNNYVSSTTNHQSIIDFKGQSYFIYHTGDLPGGGDYRRSVCVDYLYYNPDGTIREIVQTPYSVQHADSTALCPPTPLDFSLKVNDGTSVTTRRESLIEGDDVLLSPSTTENGTWQWEGPDGLAQPGQNLNLTDISLDQAGAYYAIFTNGCGIDSYMRFDLEVNNKLPDSIQTGRYYQIQPLTRDEVVTVSGGGTGNGTNVLLAENQSSTWQEFRFTLAEDVFWQISPRNVLSRGLDVNAFSQDNGANVQIWDYWGGTTQQWQIIQVSDSTYNLVARHSGKCMDYNSTTGNIYQWACNGTGRQEFLIYDSSQATTDLAVMPKQGDIRVYPNPTSTGILHVDLTTIVAPQTIRLIDMQGRDVLETSELQKKMTIEVARLPVGLYLLEVKSAEQVYTTKIQIQ